MLDPAYIVKRRGAAAALLVFLALAFYAKPLFTDTVTIQWDAVSFYYPAQKYFADHVREGRLPFWTPVLFGGFPLVADLEVGGFYPLNWPFFLLGVTPRSLYWELWLSACVAAVGAYLLARRLTGSRAGGLAAGIAYGLSGYFAAHSEHINLFECAAWLPLILWLLLRAIERPRPGRLAALALAGGCMCLAGYFQTALYTFTAAALVAVVVLLSGVRRWRAIALSMVALVAGAAAIAAIQILPAAELLAHSLRASLEAQNFTHGILHPGSVATFVWPNALGALNERYSGPPDITQHYFYAGILLLPAALAGLLDRRVRWIGLALAVPALWYAAGPPLGLYSLVVRLPAFSSVRAPAHAMFVAALGLALLAGAGVARLRARWLLALVLAFWFGDLLYWNMLRNPMVGARGTFEQVHGPSERWFQALLGTPPGRFERLAAPGRWVLFYPAIAPFQYRIETTYGSNPLFPTRWYEYLVAMNDNPRLMSAAGVSKYFDRREWVVHKHAPVLPRFYFPPEIVESSDPRLELRAVDPVRTSVERSESGRRVRENGTGTAEILEARDDFYRVRVRADSEAVLRVAVPWFPGWRARIDGRPAAIAPLDHALMGIRVPAGAHELELEYRSTYFALGAAISLVSVLGCAVAGLKSRAGSTYS